MLQTTLRSSPLPRRVFALRKSSSKFSTMKYAPWAPNTYPPAFRSDHIDVYKSACRGEVSIPDPYQWLEEYSSETDKWTSSQETFTRTHLDKIPDIQRLEKVFLESNNFPRAGAPHLYNDNRWYWFYNNGLDAQSSLYRSKDKELPDVSKIDGSGGELFFDTNALSEDGSASIGNYAFSECGKYFAYGISFSGSDFVTIYVRSTNSPLLKKVDIEKDADRLSDVIKFVKFSSISWTPDSKGFFYQRYPDTSSSNSVATQENGGISTGGDANAMIFYHRLGTSQSEDILVYQDKNNPGWMFSISVTDDYKYLVLYVQKDCSNTNLLWVADYDAENIGPNISWNKVIDEYEARYDVITNKGTVFYLRTNASATQYKVVTIDIAKGSAVTEFIPEKEAFLSRIMSINKDYFVLVYKQNVKDEVYVYSREGKEIVRLAKDFVGSARISGEEKQSWFFVRLSGFTSPGTIAKYDFDVPEEERWNIYRETKIKGINTSDFEAQQVWYKSYDGTKIPMFIVRHKSTPFDGTAPALQYGYGGFSISIDPSFNATILTFLQKYGAIYAVPNIRGGAEFGEDWHKGACKETKKNCFDDFIAASEYLVKNKYAAPGKIAINGHSNGGLLISACVNRAPEGTFGCAVAEAGVHDLLKFHKFTIGKFWTSDYGNPDDPQDFDFIFPLSPIHNIPKNKVFPPFLLLTADHDDRVVPMHSFKLAAELQHALPYNPNPLLLRVDKKAGHGAGTSILKKIQESADKWGFVAQSLGLVWKDST